MTTRRGWLLAGAASAASAAFAWPGLAMANVGRPPAELQAEWPQALLHGQATMRVWGLHIADIRLWLPPTTTADALRAGLAVPPTAPMPVLALELQYARAFSAASIAQRSLDEMQRAGPIAQAQAERWLQAMARQFPDVARGDRLTGVLRPASTAAAGADDATRANAVRFFHNGQLRGQVADGGFAERFFGIWLAPGSSQPALREQLLKGSA